MRIAVTSIIVFVNFILQSTLFENFELFSIRPNTALVILICFSVLRSDGESAAIGFFTGLLQDIVFGKAIGFFALLGMIIGYVCGKPFKDFYRENYFLPLFMVVIATFFYEFSIYIFTFLFRGRLDVVYYLRRIIIPSVCYNAFITLPIYRIIYAINAKLETREYPNRKLF
ncbi:rod shape-determining protein MreD [Tyzzerella sp. OttesenSCG-928-J15]|nr:rod shape-determining protein MreD [Tyzzerella sp. OttesenSCG-928-J15]